MDKEEGEGQGDEYDVEAVDGVDEEEENATVVKQIDEEIGKSCNDGSTVRIETF
ncbi:hypothetical protein [Burkholderia pseudomallei]|uniref:hypothetical protein n=1 Tax=Burkholderia pseudomallei TaxID=28450 RepID=UPI0021F6A81A|nr:hypothetical protein [Burkholderia pseudomallei]MCW0014528.1 hypothetical protein [Burkholderia pseudomallei]